MKFSFIISIAFVFFTLHVIGTESNIFNDVKYLEHLNDLDRINAELEDNFHKQWPFYGSIAQEVDGREEQEEEEEEEEKIENAKSGKMLTMAEMANNKLNHQNYRADQRSQYLRYNKPLENDFSESRPGENEYEDNVYSRDRDEMLTQLRPANPPVYPRIAAVEQPLLYPNTDGDIYEGDEVIEQQQQPEEEEQFLHPKPKFSTSNFPRIASMNIYEMDELYGGGKNNHQHNDYKFKEEEEFGPTINYDKVPTAKDDTEFGIRPSDPRFYRDATDNADSERTENLHQKSAPSSISKPKVNSRSDQSLENRGDEPRLDGPYNDVKVEPFQPDPNVNDTTGVYIIAIVAGISAAASVGLIAVGIGWYNLQKHLKNAEDSDYPSYGVVGPNKDYEKKNRDEAGDKRLAQSAQMYHYQHQKQQIIAMGRNHQGHGSQSDSDEEEDEEGNYTVYECPGLASIEGPLEVKNPMFDDDQLATPQQTPLQPTKASEDPHK
ncbi:hypothetical protein ABEB36_002005 [Hypothenemus hampei]|uniref:Uncharacterized protein n=1 Tax=Hypothenemus hampei TaxID=57062 RepID=A0ABD1FJX6_HYPHA